MFAVTVYRFTKKARNVLRRIKRDLAVAKIQHPFSAAMCLVQYDLSSLQRQVFALLELVHHLLHPCSFFLLHALYY